MSIDERQATSGGREAAGAARRTCREELSLRQVWQVAKLSMKIDPKRAPAKISKMKVDSDKLLKINREISDKKYEADELLKIQDLKNMPMSC
ncbi:MAG: hypothetical protein ABSG32_21290 [Terriglobia bacterium]|jgi:hypothetical protein